MNTSYPYTHINLSLLRPHHNRSSATLTSPSPLLVFYLSRVRIVSSCWRSRSWFRRRDIGSFKITRIHGCESTLGRRPSKHLCRGLVLIFNLFGRLGSFFGFSDNLLSIDSGNRGFWCESSPCRAHSPFPSVGTLGWLSHIS